MVNPSRRAVLGAALASPLAAALPSMGGNFRKGRLLVLGGTRFLGPPTVRAALAADWEVTLFNRGKSNPDLFRDLQWIKGDRDTGDLKGLAQGKWDAVVDTSGYVPGHVEATAKLLGDRIETYVFVSTVSVYPDQSAARVDEATATSVPSAEVLAQVKTIRQAGRHYGPLKAECERVAEKTLPGRVAVVRPGLIVGPGDRSDRFTYWPVRVARGGEVLAPGNPLQEVQFIDVRDLGKWCFDLGAQQSTGVFNAVGFRGRLSIEEFLHGCKVVLNTEASFTWVAEDFLLERKARPYWELPLWLPAGQRGHFDVTLALAAGLSPRSVARTIVDTFAWQEKERTADHRWRAGMRAEREKALLDAWHAR